MVCTRCLYGGIADLSGLSTQFAITSRRPEMVKFLLDKGADATELFGVYHRYYLRVKPLSSFAHQSRAIGL
jgi:hypothetical protein